MRKNFQQEFGERFLEMLEAQEPINWINMTSESSPIEIIPGVPSIGKTITIEISNTRKTVIPLPKEKDYRIFSVEMSQETLLSRFELAEILDEE